jgi:predicted small lipoprotein YifL
MPAFAGMTKNPMRAVLLLSLLLLAACGQAGDLYLPPGQADTAPASAPADTPPDEQDKDKDKDKK